MVKCGIMDAQHSPCVYCGALDDTRTVDEQRGLVVCAACKNADKSASDRPTVPLRAVNELSPDLSPRGY